jgi:hypothetical protein
MKKDNKIQLKNIIEMIDKMIDLYQKRGTINGQAYYDFMKDAIFLSDINRGLKYIITNE